MKVIVAGNRTFNHYSFLKKVLDLTFKNVDNPVIISGTARGADRLGERYAKENGLKVLKYPADWDKHGKSAGYKRNKIMALKADTLVAFWDGESRGTKHMIDLAKQYKLKVRVIPVSKYL